MKLEPRLPQLPSLGELLEHPRVKVLVQRINRSTLAQRAGGFLEEMRASLAQRAGRVEAPSLTHLAERLARRLLGEPAAGGPVINATGLVLGDDALAAPLPEPALHAIVQMAGEYHRRDAALRCAAERGLSDLAGSEAAYLTASFDGAVTLVAASMAGNRELVVVGDGSGASSIDWRWVAARAGAMLTLSPPAPSPIVGRAGEGGDAGTPFITPPPAPPHQGEGSGGFRRRAAAIVCAPGLDDAQTGVDLAALAAEAQSCGACLIDVAPIAGTINPRDHGYQDVATVGERLAAGADLVVAAGAGLLGGPACGVIVGRRRLIEQLAEHPLASLLAVDPLAVAALDAVLRVYRDDATAPAIYQLPVWQLLSAPLANLEQRAVRLATLMGESGSVASAAAREVESSWRRWGARAWSGKSWAIELRPADGDAAALAAHLGRGPYAIAARQSEDSVELDLRTVFPRWDQQLVAAVDAAGRRE